MGLKNVSMMGFPSINDVSLLFITNKVRIFHVYEIKTFGYVLKENRDAACSYQNNIGISDVLMSITQLMYTRFAQLIDSPRAQEVVLGWLVKGFEPIAIGQILGCSSKVVYHYRLIAMKILGIQHRTRDFVASLAVTAGPISIYQTVSYPVPEIKVLDRIDTVGEPMQCLEHKCR